ncbi:pentatricopeptide repeat-containing protein [Senna tora]|uniref:Pentatricopeptide repeat-containing protein n=1 Tax=Senna tora TaxID=362788 RepID=A0A834WWM1_9FABA|nr:pentatricopeptide repeat-containing protein [Senna tora]
MIYGYSKSYGVQKALSTFSQMPEHDLMCNKGFRPNSMTYGSVLSACASIFDLEWGIHLHARILRTEHSVDALLGSGLVDMYAKCGCLEFARKVFGSLVEHNEVSWTTLISGQKYVTLGELLHVYTIKSGMDSSVPVGNAIVTMYAKCGNIEKASHAFGLMPLKDIISWTAMITACSQIGDIEKAWKYFNNMPDLYEKNLVSWNAMMAGYAQNGLGGKVIEIFEDMLKIECKPDGISFVAVLSGCSHMGLVEEDLLGRAGLLDEAKNLIDGIPFKPNAAVWGALLGACRIHHHSRLAETAVKNLMELNVEDSGCFVLLANIYTDSGELEGLANVRKMMKEKGIRKRPGCSWIEVGNRVHVFTVDDTNHPQIKEIYIKLEEMMKKIEDTGRYSGAVATHRSQKYHSEKLAFAFGLLSLPSWMPIHVMKNLRVCDDCHLVIKLMSFVTSRELIMRDGYRFHHFRDGLCSCGDYW